MKEKPHPDMSFEMEARASGFLCVAGVDEAGRGPLAGPVVAGAVILPVLAEELTGLNDSKQLTAAKRERLFLALLECEQAVCSVGVASVEEIDRFNILRAWRWRVRWKVCPCVQISAWWMDCLSRGFLCRTAPL